MKFTALVALALASSAFGLPSPLAARNDQPTDCGLGADLCTEVKTFGLGCCQKIDDLMIIVATTGDIWYGLWEQDHGVQSWEEYQRRKNLLKKLKAHKTGAQ